MEIWTINKTKEGLRLKQTITKSLVSTLAVAVVATVFVPTAFGAAPLTVYINNQPLNSPVPPVVIQERTLVPVRSYMEALGADVSWQAPDTVLVQREDLSLSLRLGDTRANVGGHTVAMEVPAQVIGGSTFVPLRFLAEELGATVAFDGNAVRVTAPVATRVVSDGPLNIRSNPGTSSPLLLTVPNGTRLNVLASFPDWTQVLLPRERIGWVATRYTEPLPKRPPLDAFADVMAKPAAYLQVQGTCLGATPVLGGATYAPVASTVAALGGTMSGGDSDSVVAFQGRSWPVPQADVVRMGGEALLPARTLAQGLGLTVSWEGYRSTALLDAPGLPSAGAAPCNPWSPVGSYAIMDARSGQVISEQRADSPRQIASITKIMTSLLAVERGNPDSIVTASRSAASQVCTCMGLKTGDRVRLGDMLYGMMIPSGNDAAVAIAEHLSGRESSFAWSMTQRAAQAGATNTRFYTASGLDDWSRPYSTARDMANISREAMANPEFRAVASRQDYMFYGPRGAWSFTGHNDFVRAYPGATGLKSGWTPLAGHTLVASAYRGGTELILVILGAPTRDQLYKQATYLMDRGFDLAGNAWLPNR